jgi:hypothetical protein
LSVFEVFWGVFLVENAVLGVKAVKKWTPEGKK